MQLPIASGVLYHDLRENFWAPTAMPVSDMDEADELFAYAESVTTDLLRIFAPEQLVKDMEQYATAEPGAVDFSTMEETVVSPKVENCGSIKCEPY